MDLAGVVFGMRKTPLVLASRASRRAFFGVTALVFVVCATLTVVWCLSMQAMGELPMPGGWSLSMTWAPMCGQKWPRVAATFVGMWIVMMVAMMLPSLAPVLWRYHEAIGRTGTMPARWLSALVGAGYFFVWAALGVVVFATGFALFALALQVPALARAMPVAAGIVVLLAGVAQFSAWKSRYLACSRALTIRGGTKQGIRAAWARGMCLGTHCMFCCAGLTLILLVHGVMNLAAMACVTLAMTAERLAPCPDLVARTVGVVVVVDGLWMLLRAFASA